MNTLPAAFAVVVYALGSSSCAVSYDHKKFKRLETHWQNEDIEIWPSLRTTTSNRIGSKSGGPWRLNIVAEAPSDVSGIRILSAALKTPEASHELLSKSPAGVLQLNDGYANHPIGKAVDLEYGKGREVTLLLKVEVVRRGRAQTYRLSFKFIEDWSTGWTTMNPLLDIT